MLSGGFARDHDAKRLIGVPSGQVDCLRRHKEQRSRVTVGWQTGVELLDHKENDFKPSKVDPGAEAADLSPGEAPSGAAPPQDDLKRVDRMYEEAAKKLADDDVQKNAEHKQAGTN